MHYLKILNHTPKRVKPSEIDPQYDRLCQNIFDNQGRLIVKRTHEITPKLIEKLRNHGLKRVMIAKASTRWVSTDTIARKQVRILKEKHLNPVKKGLLGNLTHVDTLDQVERLLQKKQTVSRSTVYSQTVTVEQELEILKSTKRTINKHLKTADTPVKETVIELLDHEKWPDVSLDPLRETARDEFWDTFKMFKQDVKDVREELYSTLARLNEF